jgi:hypothetical protein
MTHQRRFAVSATGAAAAILMLALAQCTIKKPVTPSWDVHFELPLIDSTFTISKWVEDSHDLSVSGDNVYLDIDQKTEAVRIGDYLTTRMVWNEDDLDFTGTGYVRGARESISDTLTMNNTILIEEAVFDSGSVSLEVDNQSGFTLNLHAEVPSLTYPDNATVTMDSFNVGPGKSSIKIPLTGVRFRPIISGGKNLVPYDGTITLWNQTSVSNRTVKVRVDLSHVKYKRVTGWLNRTEAAIDETVETGLKISDEFNGIELGSALMSLTLFNHVQVPGSLDVTVTGESEDGRTASVPIRAAVGSASTTTVGPMEVAALANILPKTLRIHGLLYMGDGSTKSTVSSEDSIETRIQLKAPLIFSLPARTNETEPDTIEMKGDRDFVDKNLKEAGLTFHIENHIPFGVEVVFFFDSTRSEGALYDMTPANQSGFSKTITLKRPVTSPVSGTADHPGLVTSASINDISVALDSTEIKVFDNPEIFWGMQLKFPGTNGMVKVRADDWIRVQCRVEALIRADFEEDDEKGGGS